MPNELTESSTREPRITFTTALLCQHVLRDKKDILISAINIIDTITLERQPEWVEFFALLIATSDQATQFNADIGFHMRYPSGRVDQLPAPESLNFGTPLSTNIQRPSGAKLIIDLRIQFGEVGNYTFIASVGGIVAEIPFTVLPRAN